MTFSSRLTSIQSQLRGERDAAAGKENPWKTKQTLHSDSLSAPAQRIYRKKNDENRPFGGNWHETRWLFFLFSLRLPFFFRWYLSSFAFPVVWEEVPKLRPLVALVTASSSVMSSLLTCFSPIRPAFFFLSTFPSMSFPEFSSITN